MISVKILLALVFLLAAGNPVRAGTLEIRKVTDGIWALIGPNEQRSAANLANNATFGMVVTDEGVVLIDPGGSWQGAEQIHAAIRTLTDRPVKYVIDTGGQDHRWLGNGYWRAEGARVIASADAVADQQERGSMQLSLLAQLIGQGLAGTEPAYADVIFDDAYLLDFGGLRFDIVSAGPAHTPGDSFVWLAAKRTVFTGDIIFVDRLLGIGPQSNAEGWIAAIERIAALQPEHVVPGHGHATTLARAKADTYDYLVDLRQKIADYIETGGDAIGSVKVDQSAFARLEQFEALAGRNAQQVFTEMEWE